MELKLSKERLIQALLGVVLVFIVIYRFFFIGTAAATWDQVDFALALDRFDLSEMQPHFPGYPYFILGGMIVHFWVNDPVQALIVFNKIMVGLSAIPMILIARRYFPPTYCLLAVLFWQSLPYLNVLSSMPMSEAAAISVLWWLLWSIFVAIERPGYIYQIVPLLIFSLLLGIRLSYIPFAVLIVGLWVIDWRRCKGSFRTWRLTSLVVAAAAFQFVWVGALIVSVGDFEYFLSLAFSFTGGHFTDWGGAITKDSTPLGSRFVTLIVNNIVWVGLACQTIILVAVYGIMTGIGAAVRVSIKRTERAFLLLFGLSTGSYFLWALFAQNIAKPRHIAPILIFVVFWIALKWGHLQLHRKWKLGVVIVVTGFQLLVGFQLMKEYVDQTPATYKLVQFLQEKEEPLIVFSWEETRVMDYMDAEFNYERIFTYERFLQRVREYDFENVYVTDHVLDGFEIQGIDVEGKIEPVAQFESNPIFDPEYGEIVLYRWILE
jgi:hypothetical protein